MIGEGASVTGYEDIFFTMRNSIEMVIASSSPVQDQGELY